MPPGSVIVLGGGIAGLAAAWELTQAHPGIEVSVLEAAATVGGKLAGAEVAGCVVDVGAESMLARRPEATDLVRQVGLAGDLVHPTGASAAIWSRGALHPMPRRALMGVPAAPADLLGLLTAAEVERAGAEPPSELSGTRREEAEDVSVGELVGSRLGRAVVDRLTEPLLGGVYAGHADLLSTAAALPALLPAYLQQRSLTATVADLLPPVEPASHRAPVFAGIDGGVHRLPQVLAARLAERGVTVRTGVTARQLLRETSGFTVVTGPVPDPTAYHADAVLLAVPAAPAARLLRDVAPHAATELASIETASSAVVSLALPRPAAEGLPGSGVLVPPVEGLTIKAATFSAGKWDWVRDQGGPGLVLLRASAGRHREEATLQRSDEELVRAAMADLTRVLGRRLPEPVHHHVQRWGGGLPQYAVGHPARVSRIRAAVARVPGLAVCGAAYDGVGIPACVASARTAVATMAA